MANAHHAGEWPLVGRDEELALLRQLRSARQPKSVVLSGPAGVGKTRLARAAVGEAEREGWATLSVRGSAGYGLIPLGPFRTVLQNAGGSDLLRLTESVAGELARLRSVKGLLLLVEDCHDLDSASAGMLHQLVSGGVIISIMTTRQGANSPEAVTALWKDGFAQRLELMNLSLVDTTQLLLAGLDSGFEDSSAKMLWHVTAGNPLYLREVVLASLETSALTLRDGEWRWRGEWASGSRLQEIVATRLGRLDPDELTAMELLAMGGTLPLSLVARIATAHALEQLEARTLITVEQSGRRTDVSIAHPLHAEVLRARMPQLRQKSLRRTLVDAVNASGARRVADRVRIACWSIDLGLEVDPTTLTLASDAALFAANQVIAAKLAEIVPGSVPSVPTGPVVPRDHELAVRLARTAYERSGSVADAAKLASTLAWTGMIDGAEDVLAEVAKRSRDADDRLRLAIVLGWIRFWGRFDVEGAESCLLEAAADAADGNRSLLAEIWWEFAGIALQTARPSRALECAERSAEVLGVPLARCRAAEVAAGAIGYCGRCDEAIRFVEEALPYAQESGQMYSVVNLLLSRAGALFRSGQLEEAREQVERMRDVAIHDGLLEACGTYGVMLGEILLRQGRFASAARVFVDACGLLAEHDTMGWRPWALSGLARARARGGELAAAELALAEAQSTQPIVRLFDLSLHLAAVDAHMLAGREDEAVAAAEVAADWAREHGMPVEEAFAVDALVRAAPSPSAANRLAELASVTHNELVRVLAAHASALVEEDAAALRATAGQLAEMAAWWLAAEAASSAGRIFEGKRERGHAREAARFAASCLERCDGVRIVGVAGPPALAPREREVALLAAKGCSNKEIAGRMDLSTRTVENYLYRTYTKLGVTSR
ncbi:MAG TPA: LuxR C-terminal-related transcriptional regulator, partial [Acidimicrobiales bacterium]|nr:LuxR C-terminal-related transcriptional regulator [Acidimicrobiales bacterium]